MLGGDGEGEGKGGLVGEEMGVGDAFSGIG